VNQCIEERVILLRRKASESILHEKGRGERERKKERKKSLIEV
jgi:hypothetical protein